MVAGYWSIELTRIECSSKLLEGHIKRGPDVGEECKEVGEAHTGASTCGDKARDLERR